MKTEKFKVTGMTCAACQANVEKVACKLDGVESAQVNLLSEQLTVSFDDEKLTEQNIIDAVNNIGYGASLFNQKSIKNGLKEQWQDRRSNEQEKESSMKKRLISSIAFLVVLMYVAMGHMLSIPLPHFLHGTENAIVNALLQMLLTIPVMIINKKFFVSGFKGLIKRTANMDSLVALGSGASFIYGLFSLFMMAHAAPRGDLEALVHFSHELYFESSAMILTLVTVGKYLETKSKRKTGDALGKLVELSPKTANVIKDGKEITVAAEDIKTGDEIIIRPGERIAVDGVLKSGNGYIDQSAVTGESLPVEKSVGDEIISATLNKNGTFTMTATKVGENTTLSQIIKLVDEAGSSKAPIARLADKVSGVFVPVVMAISLITFIIWLVTGAEFSTALSFGITVLVISCPCALGLATPVAIMVGTGKAAENGILIKSAAALENLGNVNKIVLDKTGTITSGEMTVSDIVVIDKSYNENEFLKICAAIESGSEHPLAEAVRKKSKEQSLLLPQSSDFEAVQGKGVKCLINGKKYLSGNPRFLSEENIEIASIEKTVDELSKQGKTPLIFAEENNIIGIIAVSDTIRNDSIEAIKAFKAFGKTTVMLTGDNKNAAQYIAEKAGVDEVFAELLPADKESILRKLQENGEKVAFIGDGINDAPALTRADVGIAIGAGTDIAIDAADIVLIKSSLSDGAKAVELSKAVMKNIKMNLFWAFFYNTLGIPLAAGVLYPAFAIKLTPMIGSAAMSLSSVSVVTNALRLRFFKSKLIIENNTDEAEEAFLNQKEGNDIMTKVIKVDGMMCPRCEAHVTKALLAIDGVEEATASHEESIATVTLSKEVADDVLIKAIVDEGYEAQI
ncbi:MAG: heavy metal translocating P-type ATPase [Clostridia bacterium]|nr:heavy metal translocating P-type ATPase [Clostridia bacterium]